MGAACRTVMRATRNEMDETTRRLLEQLPRPVENPRQQPHRPR